MLDTERVNTPAVTSWPLGITASKLSVFNQPSVSHDNGLTRDWKVEQPPAA